MREGRPLTKIPLAALYIVHFHLCIICIYVHHIYKFYSKLNINFYYLDLCQYTLYIYFTKSSHWWKIAKEFVTQILWFYNMKILTYLCLGIIIIIISLLYAQLKRFQYRFQSMVFCLIYNEKETNKIKQQQDIWEK